MAFEEGYISGSAGMARIRYGHHDGGAWSASNVAIGSGFVAIAVHGSSPRVGWIGLSGGLY